MVWLESMTWALLSLTPDSPPVESQATKSPDSPLASPNPSSSVQLWFPNSWFTKYPPPPSFSLAPSSFLLSLSFLLFKQKSNLSPLLKTLRWLPTDPRGRASVPQVQLCPPRTLHLPSPHHCLYSHHGGRPHSLSYPLDPVRAFPLPIISFWDTSSFSNSQAFYVQDPITFLKNY